MSQDATFPCKDCEQDFSTAKAFVAHVASCVPVADRDALLRDAVALVRRWVYQGQRRFTHKSGVKLTHQTEEWLKANGLQGGILR